MGRFTSEYVPDEFVVVVRVRDVDSSTTVIDTLGITPPDASVTSPVRPPSVCCARTCKEHNAATVANINSRKDTNERTGMEYFNLLASEGFSWSFSIWKSTQR